MTVHLFGLCGEAVTLRLIVTVAFYQGAIWGDHNEVIHVNECTDFGLGNNSS
jgi:hypothetical protein